MSEIDIGENERAVDALLKELRSIPFAHGDKRERMKTEMRLKLQARTVDRLEHIASILDSLIIEGNKVRTVPFR